METSDRFWNWVNDNINEDPSRLRLKYHAINGDIDFNLAIIQIECRQKYKKKLSVTLEKYPRFLFPSQLSGEQATSDRLARFHASLLPGSCSLIDLTAGLGIDLLHCASKAVRAVAIEKKNEIAQALVYNMSLAGHRDISIINGDCIGYIERFKGEKYDVAFIDPARRAADGSRIYSLAQCEPDITGMIPSISGMAGKLIIKASPMLDISHTLNSIPEASRIISLGTPTECKELIIIAGSDEICAIPRIDAVTLSPSGTDRFSFTMQEEHNAMVEYKEPSEGDFLYEPSPAIMKAGPMKLLSARYGVSKIHPNTHLYISTGIIPDFPGEIHIVENIIPYSSKYIKRIRKDYPTINVSTRNFGMSASCLKNKLGIKDGGNLRLMGTTDICGKKQLLILKHVDVSVSASCAR